MQRIAFINECRIPLNEVQKLKVLKYPTKGLSARHKRYLERTIEEECGRISIFDGDILFWLIDQEAPTDKERELAKQYLQEQISKFNEKFLQPVTMLQLPKTTVERLIFALIVAQAKTQGIYRLRGRTLFEPTRRDTKSHGAADVTLVTEDDWIKLYLVPTLVALTEIGKSQRVEKLDVQAIGLCTFRNRCPLVNENGACKYIKPGYLGFVAQEGSLSQLEEETKENFVESFNDCPQIGRAEKIIEVKPTKQAIKTVGFPDYTIHLPFADNDFGNEQKTQFRDYTLMSSEKRWDKTHEWMFKIFGNLLERTPSEQTTLEIGGVQLPLEVLLEQGITTVNKVKQPYKLVFFPDQKIITDSQNLRPSTYGGGYEFNRLGAYDRHDISRPFREVAPHLIVPQTENIALLSRQLMKYLADGYVAKEGVPYDKPFTGINQDNGYIKYKTRFVDPWGTEELSLLDDTSDQNYLDAVDTYIRRWNAQDERDSSRIVIVIKPPQGNTASSEALYYKLKSKFAHAGIPNQFISFETLEKISLPRSAFGPILNTLWLNIYAKMGGKPWRIESEIGNVHCFIGIGFGLNVSKLGEHIYAGVAHVFDKFGNWVDVTSNSHPLGEKEFDSFVNQDRFLQGTASFKISQETTESIVYNALSLYKDKQSLSSFPPQNIVLHKLGPVYDCEVLGFLEAIKRVNGNLDMCRLGILQIEQDHLRRLYGNGDTKSKINRVVDRGLGLLININKLLLATTGKSRDRYPGIGTPNPLLLTSILPTPQMQEAYSFSPQQFYDIETLGKHVMALTQLHWGSTRDNVRQPITTLYAQKVADLTSKMETNIDVWTSYHRPWFL